MADETEAERKKREEEEKKKKRGVVPTWLQAIDLIKKKKKQVDDIP
jgi:hypothetical protein